MSVTLEKPRIEPVFAAADLKIGHYISPGGY
jgi:hypothetical protein